MVAVDSEDGQADVDALVGDVGGILLAVEGDLK